MTRQFWWEPLAASIDSGEFRPPSPQERRDVFEGAGVHTTIMGDSEKRTGMKWDVGKEMLGLVPPLTATRIAKVMTDAVTRADNPYEINSWKNVQPRTRYLDALERHLEAMKAGEAIDPLSGTPHIDHVLTNAAILSWFHGQGEEITYHNQVPKKA